MLHSNTYVLRFYNKISMIIVVDHFCHFVWERTREVLNISRSTSKSSKTILLHDDKQNPKQNR